MSKMKNYEEIEIEIVAFTAEDVITRSCPGDYQQDICNTDCSIYA